MGGATLEVLSPFAAERVAPVLGEELVAEGLTRYEPDPGYWYSADGLPYGWDVHGPAAETDPADLVLLERATGLPMRCAAGLHIFVGDPAGRTVLARIAQRVAQRANGWVFVEFRDAPSDSLLRHLSEAGHCVRADDAAFLDADAMSAWIAHAEFHVVK